MISLQVSKFQIVNILGFNSPEWLIANNGSILASCIAAGIYSTNTPEACHYVTSHSKAEVVVVEGNKQLAKYADIPKSDLPSLKAIVLYGEDAIDPKILAKCNFTCYLWKDFMNLGSGVSDQDLHTRFDLVRPGNCAALIYTSGTTGPPKAVMISHDNLTWVSANIGDNFFDLNHSDRICSYLPLSHIAAQAFDVHVPMYLGCSLYFCQPDALKGTLTVTLKEVNMKI